MKFFKELHGSWNMLLDWWSMRGRNPENECWIFHDDGSVTIVPRPPTLFTLLVILGVTDSNSESNRAFKEYSVELREWWSPQWWHKMGPKDAIPVGYPHWIRRGKMWGKTFMFPVTGQSDRCWQEIVNEK